MEKKEKLVSCMVPEEMKDDLMTAIENGAKTLDDVYRYVWQQYTKTDVLRYAKDMGVEISDDQADIVADRYTYEGKYDCNLSYWDNLKNLINEEIG